MRSEKFFQSKTAVITLFAACFVVLISLGVRQTFGLFFFDFEVDLGCTQTEFGFAMGIQLFFGFVGGTIITDGSLWYLIITTLIKYATLMPLFYLFFSLYKSVKQP